MRRPSRCAFECAPDWPRSRARQSCRSRHVVQTVSTSPREAPTRFTTSHRQCGTLRYSACSCGRSKCAWPDLNRSACGPAVARWCEWATVSLRLACTSAPGCSCISLLCYQHGVSRRNGWLRMAGSCVAAGRRVLAEGSYRNTPFPYPSCVIMICFLAWQCGGGA